MTGTPTRSRWTKRLLVAAAVFALLLGGGYLALALVFPPERITTLVADQVSSRTGRDFRIDGKLTWRVLPRVAVVADGLVLGNAPWGSRKDMLRVKRAALELELWPLLRGALKVGSVELDGVDLLLETDGRGEGNWILSQPPGKAESAPGTGSNATRSFELDGLRLRDVAIAYRDHGVQHALALSKLDLERKGPGNRIAAEWTMQKQRVRASGQLGSVDALLSNAADWPFDVELGADGVRIVAKGHLLHGAAPRAARLTVDAAIDKAAALEPWVADADGVPMPIVLKSTLVASSTAVKADPLTLSVAGQALSGQAAWRSGDPWQLDASLKAATFDLASVLPKRAATGAGSTAQGGGAHQLFGDNKLPFDTLPNAIAKVALRLDQLRLPGVPPLSGVTLVLNLKPGSLHAEPLTFGVAGGKVRGAVTLKPGTSPLLNVQVAASDLSAEALARAAGSDQVGGGRIQLTTTLAMTGNTPRALAAGANGDLLLTLKDATLAEGALPMGPNLLPRLLQIVQPNRGAPKATTVECAVVKLPFRNGVAAVDRSIAAETNVVTFSASGRIDLRDQTLDLAIHPRTRAALGVNASLVVAKGPLLDPKLAIDAKGAANMALAIGAAAATGGLSALSKKLLDPKGDAHPCAFAETGVAALAPAQPVDEGTRNTGKSPAGKPDDIRKLLRGLFK